MPINVSWYIENRIIEVTFSGAVTVEEIEQGAKETMALFDQSDQAPIHVMHDYGDMTDFPKNIKLIAAVSRHSFADERRGWVVPHSIKQNLARFILVGASQLSRTKINVVNTHEQALAFLRQIDPTLEAV